VRVVEGRSSERKGMCNAVQCSLLQKSAESPCVPWTTKQTTMHKFPGHIRKHLPSSLNHPRRNRCKGHHHPASAHLGCGEERSKQQDHLSTPAPPPAHRHESGAFETLQWFFHFQKMKEPMGPTSDCQAGRTSGPLCLLPSPCVGLHVYHHVISSGPEEMIQVQAYSIGVL
jgi:hypothetical protein